MRLEWSGGCDDGRLVSKIKVCHGESKLSSCLGSYEIMETDLTRTIRRIQTKMMEVLIGTNRCTCLVAMPNLQEL